MTELSKKELVSHLYDAFADRVAALDKDLRENHGYMTAGQQHDNLVTDIGSEVAEAGWKVSAGVIDALCHGGAELMALDLSAETVVAPPVTVDEHGLRQDGPTLEEYVRAGYVASGYPPRGYAARPSTAQAEPVNQASGSAQNGDIGMGAIGSAQVQNAVPGAVGTTQNTAQAENKN
jgi:hypothetical protein